jgi:carboxyl-terminal processing protease
MGLRSRTEVGFRRPGHLDCVPNDVGLIGLTVAAEDGVQYPEITAVSPGGAADKAGIASGVYLLSVDGISMEGLSLADVVAKIRGPVNSTVHVAVSGTGDAPPRVFELQRQ